MKPIEHFLAVDVSGLVIFLMGKKGGSSWLTAVKRVLRSPGKDSEKKNHRRKDDEQEEEEEKVLPLTLTVDFARLHCSNFFISLFS